MKVKEIGMSWKAKPQSTFLSSFMNVMVMASEKMSIFELFKIFHQPLWPWPWVKVTQTGMVWKASPQITILAISMAVNVILSEQISMLKIFGTDGRTGGCLSVSPCVRPDDRRRKVITQTQFIDTRAPKMFVQLSKLQVAQNGYFITFCRRIYFPNGF